MDKKTYYALQESISHWESNVAAASPLEASCDSDDCALCRMFVIPNDHCFGCPVAEATKVDDCQNTPFYDARHVLFFWLGRSVFGEGRGRQLFRDAAQKEVDFLRALVPAGGPDDEDTGRVVDTISLEK